MEEIGFTFQLPPPPAERASPHAVIRDEILLFLREKFPTGLTPILISGKAGFGKSALARQLVFHATREGTPAENSYGMVAWLDAREKSLLHAQLSALRALSTGESHPPQLAMDALVVNIIAQLVAARRPALIVFDGCANLDAVEEMRKWMGLATVPAGAPAIHVIFTYREEADLASAPLPVGVQFNVEEAEYETLRQRIPNIASAARYVLSSAESRLVFVTLQPLDQEANWAYYTACLTRTPSELDQGSLQRDTLFHYTQGLPLCLNLIAGIHNMLRMDLSAISELYSHVVTRSTPILPAVVRHPRDQPAPRYPIGHPGWLVEMIIAWCEPAYQAEHGHAAVDVRGLPLDPGALLQAIVQAAHLPLSGFPLELWDQVSPQSETADFAGQALLSLGMATGVGVRGGSNWIRLHAPVRDAILDYLRVEGTRHNYGTFDRNAQPQAEERIVACLQSWLDRSDVNPPETMTAAAHGAYAYFASSEVPSRVHIKTYHEEGEALESPESRAAAGRDFGLRSRLQRSATPAEACLARTAARVLLHAEPCKVYAVSLATRLLRVLDPAFEDAVIDIIRGDDNSYDVSLEMLIKCADTLVANESIFTKEESAQEWCALVARTVYTSCDLTSAEAVARARGVAETVAHRLELVHSPRADLVAEMWLTVAQIQHDKEPNYYEAAALLEANALPAAHQFDMSRAGGGVNASALTAEILLRIAQAKLMFMPPLPASGDLPPTTPPLGYLVQACDILEAFPGHETRPVYLDALTQQAEVLSSRAEGWQQSVALYQKLVAILEARTNEGEMHPRLRAVLGHMAGVYHQMGDQAQYYTIMRRVHRISQRRQGRDSFAVVTLELTLAQNDPFISARAKRVATEHALEVYTALFGATHGMTLQVAQQLHALPPPTPQAAAEEEEGSWCALM